MLGRCERCIVSGVRWFPKLSEPLTHSAWHANNATGNEATLTSSQRDARPRQAAGARLPRRIDHSCASWSAQCTAMTHTCICGGLLQAACDPALFVLNGDSYVLPGRWITHACLTRQCFTEPQSSLLSASVSRSQLMFRISAAWRRHCKDVLVCQLQATDHLVLPTCSEHVNT